MFGDGRAVLLVNIYQKIMKDMIFNLKVLEKLHFQEMVMVELHLGPMLREYIISEAMHGFKNSNNKKFSSC
jgi:uncharacterized protein YdiU (UPF0061 family)